MPCELCDRKGTVSVKPIQDLIQKLENAKKERKGFEEQFLRQFNRNYKLDKVKTESDDIRFR